MNELIFTWVFNMVFAMFHGVFWFMVIGLAAENSDNVKRDVDGISETAMFTAIMLGGATSLITTLRTLTLVLEG